jgi:hypothetical protein
VVGESELARGRRLAVGSRLRLAFALMDATGRLALRADEVLARRVAPAGPLFRRVLIVGRRRGSAR